VSKISLFGNIGNFPKLVQKSKTIYIKSSSMQMPPKILFFGKNGFEIDQLYICAQKISI